MIVNDKYSVHNSDSDCNIPEHSCKCILRR
ncbi:hypothetical protein VCHA39O224_80035 [Vibrio chagasii]|nr:hypothetical protein VCHA39O224_80035 [Vibrio chagasii]